MKQATYIGRIGRSGQTKVQAPFDPKQEKQLSGVTKGGDLRVRPKGEK
ncbi:MAG: hypothetical protein IJP30_04270 [Clostridia bacterium]|nr:hypothetical protein [Clostridia bacterium]